MDFKIIIEKERLFKCLYYADMPDDNKQFIQDLIDNQCKEIERLNHYEQENKELAERIEFYQRKTQRLEKRNKEIYDGFMATTQELCNTTKELDDYKSRCEKALNYIYKAIEQEYDEENDKGIWLTERINDLKNILNGD